MCVLSSGRHVPGASIRDQAYEDYFYGKAGVEQELGQLEGSVKPLIERAITSNTLPQWQSPEHRTLLKYVLFQDSRTPAKVAENKEHVEKLGKTLARDMPDLMDKAPSINFDDPDAPCGCSVQSRFLCRALSIYGGSSWRTRRAACS